MSTLTSLIILALSVLVCLLLSLLVKLKKQAQSQSQAQTTEPAPAVTGPSVTLIANVGGIFSIIKGNQMTNATVNNTITLTAAFTDAKGNPTAPASVPVWTLDNSALATIVPAADGLSAVVTPVGPLGTVTVTVTEGTVTGTAAIDLAAGAAASVVVTAVVA